MIDNPGRHGWIKNTLFCDLTQGGARGRKESNVSSINFKAFSAALRLCVRPFSPQTNPSSLAALRLCVKLFFPAAILLISSCVCYKPFTQFDPSGPRYVLLTFDDGPTNDQNVTRELLAVLKRHNVKALFNIIGMNARHYPAIVAEMHAAGHILANHGYTHMPLIARSTTALNREFDSTNSAIRRAIGDTLFTPRYFRPPMGWYDPHTRRIAAAKGMLIDGMTIYKLDAQAKPSDGPHVAQRIIAAVVKHGGGAIVLHDGCHNYAWLEKRVRYGKNKYDRSFVPLATDAIITALKAQGFQFAALDDGEPNALPDEQVVFFRELLY
jgi:peptidoglycan/xylan/chitin deacetylase (PgdA/CDA1 family)